MSDTHTQEKDFRLHPHPAHLMLQSCHSHFYPLLFMFSFVSTMWSLVPTCVDTFSTRLKNFHTFVCIFVRRLAFFTSEQTFAVVKVAVVDLFWPRSAFQCARFQLGLSDSQSAILFTCDHLQPIRPFRNESFSIRSECLPRNPISLKAIHPLTANAWPAFLFCLHSKAVRS